MLVEIKNICDVFFLISLYIIYRDFYVDIKNNDQLYNNCTAFFPNKRELKGKKYTYI